MNFYFLCVVVMNSACKGFVRYYSSAPIPSSKQRALFAYRSLLKTEKDLFKNDLPSLFKAVVKTREGFEKNKQETDSAKVEQLIKDAFETQNFLMRNIVQADLSEHGAYSKQLAKTIFNLLAGLNLRPETQFMDEPLSDSVKRVWNNINKMYKPK
jgi:complex III assembly factor LYRM7